jgi:energy-coupling factor transport system ATP-binding protein
VRRDILDLLAVVAKDRCLLVVTHEPELFEGVIDQGWRMDNGMLSPLEPPRT